MNKSRYLQCAVLGCDANSRDYPQLLFFSFPRNETLYNRWIEAVKNPTLSTMNCARIRSRYRVCSRHFTDFQFQTIERRKLNRNQIPSIIDPFLHYFETMPKNGCHVESVPCVELDHDYRKPIDDRLECLPTPNKTTVNQTGFFYTLDDPLFRRQPRFTPLEQKLKYELRRLKHTYAALKRRCLKRSKILRDMQTRLKKFDLIEMIEKHQIKQFENLSEIGELFLISQLRNLPKKPRLRRYTQPELDFFTNLYEKGPSTYRYLEKFFALPTVTTLRRAERVVIEHNYVSVVDCVESDQFHFNDNYVNQEFIMRIIVYDLDDVIQHGKFYPIVYRWVELYATNKTTTNTARWR